MVGLKLSGSARKGGESHGGASLSRRIFLALAGVCVAACLLVSLASAYIYQRSVVEDASGGLGRECEAVSSTQNETASYGRSESSVLRGLDLGDVRATLVAKDGTVLYDSLVPASSLPNHRSRPEVAAALKGGSSSSERDSQTVGYVSIYQAQRLDSGNVLRLSEDRDGIMRVIANDLWFVIGTVAVVVGVSWIVSRSLAWRFVQPILAIDTASGNAVSPYEELDPLVRRLNEQQVELKTPIASISGASELLRDGFVRPEDVRDFASRIYGDAQRLSSLVSDILMLSKMDESERVGDQALFGEPQDVDLLSVAQDVVDRLQDRARKANVTLHIQGANVRVSGYPRLLDELVKNLCDNAIRYNRTGGSVHVFVLPVNGHPTLRVTDTGVGIAPEDQPKVFERFYRVDKSRSRASGGTGLGLAIVKHAAALHGATIDLSSELGRGTTITVTFPADGR